MQSSGQLEAALKELRNGSTQKDAARSAGVSVERFRKFIYSNNLAKRDGPQWNMTDERPRRVPIIYRGETKSVTVPNFAEAKKSGFDGIFEDWEDTSSETDGIRGIGEYRTTKAKEFAENINSQNWPIWRERLLRFMTVESNDLATFPKLFEFLKFFAESSPDYAFGLLTENLDEVDGFTVPLLSELWKGPRRNDLRSLMLSWIKTDTQLIPIARLFWSNENVDDELIELLFVNGSGIQTENC